MDLVQGVVCQMGQQRDEKSNRQTRKIDIYYELKRALVNLMGKR